MLAILTKNSLIAIKELGGFISSLVLHKILLATTILDAFLINILYTDVLSIYSLRCVRLKNLWNDIMQKIFLNSEIIHIKRNNWNIDMHCMHICIPKQLIQCSIINS